METIALIIGSMKTGDIVQFKDGLYHDEIGARYDIVEINGDRAIIEFICDLPIPPQSVAMISELEIAQEEEHEIRDGFISTHAKSASFGGFLFSRLQLW